MIRDPPPTGRGPGLDTIQLDPTGLTVESSGGGKNRSTDSSVAITLPLGLDSRIIALLLAQLLLGENQSDRWLLHDTVGSAARQGMHLLHMRC
jgi:hypothetical protein